MEQYFYVIISIHSSDLSNKFDEKVNIPCILWCTVEHDSGEFLCYSML